MQDALLEYEQVERRADLSAVLRGQVLAAAGRGVLAVCVELDALGRRCCHCGRLAVLRIVSSGVFPRALFANSLTDRSVLVGAVSAGAREAWLAGFKQARGAR